MQKDEGGRMKNLRIVIDFNSIKLRPARRPRMAANRDKFVHS